ncbi:hypothetical protein J2792_004254 [Novosphingobium capsulatum]|uniref:Restriction endonuclease subunit S n=1 Tax=Novosphingobium capsulatum TaxID=13688 RepID=A0ABU1MSP7_9SPHN|nr:restriction endonuclease subunit S [Novosphingobium capsulatum]MDR6513360.1 hypothetical protein [Novosphingobium capsulatum]
MRLDAICQFQSGFTVRGKLDPQPEVGQLAMQLRDLREDGSIDLAGVQRFNLDLQVDRYALQPGDVVFRSRGMPNFGYVVDAAMAEPIVALLPLIILRPNSSLVAPDYLAWAINQPDAQRQIDAEAQGQSLRMIPKGSLEGITIPVPDLSTQRAIVEIARLANREAALLHQLAERRTQFTGRVLADLAQAGAQQKGL